MWRWRGRRIRWMGRDGMGLLDLGGSLSKASARLITQRWDPPSHQLQLLSSHHGPSTHPQTHQHPLDVSTHQTPPPTITTPPPRLTVQPHDRFTRNQTNLQNISTSARNQTSPDPFVKQTQLYFNINIKLHSPLQLFTGRAAIKLTTRRKAGREEGRWR